MKRPSWSILDRSKPYTPSYDTDLKAKFAKIRAEQQEQEARQRAGIVQIKRAAK